MTGVVLFGVNEWEYNITLGAPCVLADGSYWVEVFNSTAGNGSGDDWFWETGTLDPVNGVAGSVFSTSVPGAVWNPDSINDLAVQLIGAVVPVELQSFDVE
jgi:hypothetical protein